MSKYQNVKTSTWVDRWGPRDILTFAILTSQRVNPKYGNNIPTSQSQPGGWRPVAVKKIKGLHPPLAQRQKRLIQANRGEAVTRTKEKNLNRAHHPEPKQVRHVHSPPRSMYSLELRNFTFSLQKSPNNDCWRRDST